MSLCLKYILNLIMFLSKVQNKTILEYKNTIFHIFQCYFSSATFKVFYPNKRKL